MCARLAFSILVLALSGAAPLTAQEQGSFDLPMSERTTVTSPILTIDSERVYRESAYGRRVASDNAARLAELAAENRSIEADLAAEEQEITLKRPTMTAEEFRALADAFDEKVQTIKKTQVAKERTLTTALEKEREAFWGAAAPVLEQLMREAEAGVILERRSVFVSLSAIEITGDAIELLDETLGDSALADD